MLYLLYLIVWYKYKEYKINHHIESLIEVNHNTSIAIDDARKTIEYLNTDAYKNKVLKEEQWYKNKWEIVVYLTSEENYEKFTKTTEPQIVFSPREEERKIYDSMTNFQKWIYFIFDRDIR